MFALILYCLAAYGGWTLVKKARNRIKRGNLKRQLLESNTVKRLAGRK